MTVIQPHTIKPGPNENECCRELPLARVFFNSHRLSPARAKRKKHLDDSQEKLEPVPIQ